MYLVVARFLYLKLTIYTSVVWLLLGKYLKVSVKVPFVNFEQCYFVFEMRFPGQCGSYRELLLIIHISFVNVMQFLSQLGSPFNHDVMPLNVCVEQLFTLVIESHQFLL